MLCAGAALSTFQNPNIEPKEGGALLEFGMFKKCTQDHAGVVRSTLRGQDEKKTTSDLLLTFDIVPLSFVVKCPIYSAPCQKQKREGFVAGSEPMAGVGPSNRCTALDR